MKQDSATLAAKAGEPIAIIGLSCFFPGANSPAGYWSAIRECRDAIGDIPADHWLTADYYDPDPKALDKTYGRRGGFLDKIPFEPLKYGIVPNDLSAIDSTQLLGLVAADRALADAGYPAGGDYNHRRTAVMLGVTGALKMVVSLGSRLAHPQLKRALKDSGVDEELSAEIVKRFANEFTEWQENSFPGLLGNVTAGRVANRLNLGGANLVVDAACASSLAAIRQGLMELRGGQADIVVSGGVDTFSDPFMYTCFSKTPALSPTGDVRAYDQDGDGTMLGEGVGVVVMKRLADARRDNDRVFALIRGIGASSDGKSAAIFAPSAEGQVRALENAYSEAGISPATVELVEGHGTGTAVGDAVEAEALCRVFQAAGDTGQPWCALGSVKSQIGHTKAAAGVAGLIKAALALYFKVLPPTAKVKKPLPVFTSNKSPFYLTSGARPWLSKGGPRRAGVSAFGFGGSNFHCVLEEFSPLKAEPEVSADIEIFAASGQSHSALTSALEQLLKREDHLADLAANSRRTFSAQHPCRLIVAAPNGEMRDLAKKALNLVTALDAREKDAPDGVYFASSQPVKGPFGFLAPQAESAARGMFAELAADWPEMIAELSAAEAALQESAPELSPLNLALYPPDLAAREYKASWAADFKDERLRTQAAQAVHRGLTRVLARFGLTPAATIADARDLASAENQGIKLWLEVGPGRALSQVTAKTGRKALALDQTGGGRLDLARFLARLAALGLPVDFSAWPRPALAAWPESRESARSFTVNISGANHFVKKEIPPSAPRTLYPAPPPLLAPEENPAPPAAAAPIKENAAAARLSAMSRETARLHEEFLKTQNETLRLLSQSLGEAMPVAAPLAAPVAVAAPVMLQKAQDAAPVAAEEILKTVAEETGYPLDMLRLDMNLESDLGLDSIKKVEIMAMLSERWPNAPAFGAESMNTVETLADLVALAERPVEAAPPAAAVAAPPAAAPAPALARGGEELILELVAAETGYPRDMLNLSMNLERDLGLDSIRKVEIMAALSEQMPEADMPDMAGLMGSVETLADLLKLLPTGPAPTTMSTTVSTIVDTAAPVSAAKTPAGAEALLFDVVSRETGYPADMLNLDMDLETDLGLDSIRRVEIMAALSEAGGHDDGNQAAMLTDARTLGDLRKILTGGMKAPAAPAPEPDRYPRRGPGRPPKNSPPAFKEAAQKAKEAAQKAAEHSAGLASYYLEMRGIYPTAREERFGLARGNAVRLVADDSPLAAELAAELAADGLTVLQEPWAEPEIFQEHREIAALILIWPQKPLADAPLRAFQRLKASAPSLVRTAEKGGKALFVALTFMGGAFGLNGPLFPPASATLAGLAKTAAREWPGVKSRVIDLPQTAYDTETKGFVDSLRSALTTGSVEVGIASPGRLMAPHLAPYTLKNIRVRHIRENQNLVVTGGARGVTAAALKEVARAFRPHLIILGRTPLAANEPYWMRGVERESVLRQLIYDRAAEKPEPKELARQSRQILAAREIRRNIADMERAGAKVTYLSGDLINPAVARAEIAEIKRAYGPIHGFIHGAGVLADSLIADKSEADFETVFQTKFGLAQVILEELAYDPLHLIAFFSSSTARFGRRGQADYAAGNEALNKLAKIVAVEHSCKALAVNWGPWDGGMVDESLKRVFEGEGVGLIPLAEGARLFATLMGTPKNDPVEVVTLGSGTNISNL